MKRARGALLCHVLTPSCVPLMYTYRRVLQSGRIDGAASP